ARTGVRSRHGVADALRIPDGARARARTGGDATIRLRDGARGGRPDAGGEVSRADRLARRQRGRMARLGSPGRLRAEPRVGGTRAGVGRLPAALRLRVRGALRRAHDHAGRLLPVPDRAEPRLPELATLRAPDGVRGSRARASDPALLDRLAARAGRAAAVRLGPAVHARPA